MAENDHTDSARSVKRTLEPPTPPALLPGAVYTRRGVLQNLGMSAHTWKRYVNAGMPVFKPGRQFLVLSDVLIEWLQKPESELPDKYKSPNAEKNRRRRKKE